MLKRRARHGPDTFARRGDRIGLRVDRVACGRSETLLEHDDAAGTSTPMCEHTTETDAEAAAQRLAQTTGASRVVIHDRYHRTRLSAARGRGAT